MNITPIYQTNFQAKNLIPLSEYKGTILKLTTKDKEQIAKLTKKKAQYELELMKVSRHLEKYTKSITKECKSKPLLLIKRIIENVERNNGVLI